MEEDKLVKCYNCHKSLIQERVINGSLTKMFHPERVETVFYLNNNSKMAVSLCMDCKNKDLNNKEVQDNIINNVIDGWNEEMSMLMKRGVIVQQQSDEIMSNHRSLKILFKCEGMDDYQIRARAKCLL